MRKRWGRSDRKTAPTEQHDGSADNIILYKYNNRILHNYIYIYIFILYIYIYEKRDLI